MRETMTTSNKANILIVDDKPENLYALEKLLLPLDVGVITATSGPQALQLVLKHSFCLAIVDVQMPEMDGYELVSLLHDYEETAALPVIFVSAIFADAYNYQKGHAVGAVDFLSKPFQPDILLGKVQVFLRLYEQQQQLQQLNDSLRISNADKDKFLAIISGDLKQAFNALLSATQLAQIKVRQYANEDLSQEIEKVKTIAQHTYNRLENLFNWSLLQQGEMPWQPHRFALLGGVERCVNYMAEQARSKEIKVTTTIAPDWEVEVDEMQFIILMGNLLENAIRFTLPGGSISVTAQTAPTAAGLQPLQAVQIVVEDTGVGIRADHLRNLFQVDQHQATADTDQFTSGGLGLLICREIVMQHGGNIRLESERGHGTRVFVTLPLAVDAVETEELAQHEPG